MWPVIPVVAIVLSQAPQPASPSKSQEWCSDRGQNAQLCEDTEAACDKLREINLHIAQSPCKPVELPEIQVSPIEPPGPPNPAR
jgi:hypothetical protein